jgi:hypothetical protein
MVRITVLNRRLIIIGISISASDCYAVADAITVELATLSKGGSSSAAGYASGLRYDRAAPVNQVITSGLAAVVNDVHLT